MQKLTICIDWDFTFTEDPDLFTHFIRIAQTIGHRVIICTARYSDQCYDIDQLLKKHGISDIAIYYSGETPKRQYLYGHNIGVDIWIDDDPGWVVGISN